MKVKVPKKRNINNDTKKKKTNGKFSNEHLIHINPTGHC